LPNLLTLKYQTIYDAGEILGRVDNIRATFIDFQKYLYEEIASCGISGSNFDYGIQNILCTNHAK